MIYIKLVCVGKLKERFLLEAFEEYKKRLSKYCTISLEEVSEARLKDNHSIKEEQESLELEGERLLKKINDDEYVFLLDLWGEEIDSSSLALKMNNLINLGKGKMTFVIGGSNGLGRCIKKRANFKICLSKMTFTHQMTRIIIMEQIYRAFKINNHETYHK